MKKFSIRFLWLFPIILTACPNNPDISEIHYFIDMPVELSDTSATFNTGDTLWCTVEVPNQLVINSSEKKIETDNATFIFTMRISTVQIENGKDFVTQNFNIITEQGELDISQVSYTPEHAPDCIFDASFRFGCPLENTLHFGLVFLQKGIYDFFPAGKMYYGENRNDCSELSYSDRTADFAYYFDVEDVHLSKFEQFLQYDNGEVDEQLIEAAEKRLVYFFEIK